MTTATKARKARSTRSTRSRASGPQRRPRTAEGKRRLDAFCRFCRRVLTINEGGPLIVEPFQREALRDFFEGIRSTLILIPKKNGKTSILAAIAIEHLLTTPDAYVVIAAASREQATIMMNQIRGFVRRSPLLQSRLEITKRSVEYEAQGGLLEVRASDVDTLDGVIPTLGLVDALDRHKHPDVYGVIRDGLGPRDGQMIAIGTAGDDENSPLGLMRRRARKIVGLRKVKAHRHARTRAFSYHEWALDKGADLRDLDLVKLANPASWQTIEELATRHDDVSMRPWQWARFAAGIWTAGEESAISEIEWGACAVPGQTIAPGEPGVTVGIDIAFKWDTFALVPVIVEDDGTALVGNPIILEPPGDGTTLPYEDAWAAIEEMADRYPGCTFTFDPTRGGEQMMQQIENQLEGCSFVAHSQDPRPMALAAERLSIKIAERQLEHPADSTLTDHVLAAAAYFVGERWKFVKRKKKALPIDGVIALAMAVSSQISERQRRPDRANYRIEAL